VALCQDPAWAGLLSRAHCAEGRVCSCSLGLACLRWGLARYLSDTRVCVHEPAFSLAVQLLALLSCSRELFTMPLKSKSQLVRDFELADIRRPSRAFASLHFVRTFSYLSRLIVGHQYR
jgi:hypothetical protein